MRRKYPLSGDEKYVIRLALAELKKIMQDEIDAEDVVTDEDLSRNRRIIGMCVALTVRLKRIKEK